MPRPILFLAVLALGCNRPAPAPDGSAPSPGRPDEPAPAVAPSDLKKLQPTARFKVPGERDSAWVPRLSADGRRVAVSYRTPQYKNLTQVWDIATEPKILAEFAGGRGVLSPSGRLVLTHDSSQVYDVGSKKPVSNLPRSYSSAFFRDEDTTVSTVRSYNFPMPTKGEVTVWDVRKGADAGSFEVPDNRFEDASLVRGGKELWLVMSNQKFEIECYDLAGKKLARTVKPEPVDGRTSYDRAGTWRQAAPDGSVFAAAVTKTHIFDGQTGRSVAALPTDLWGTPTGFVPGGARYLARVGGGTAAAAGLGKSDFVVYDWKDQKILAAVTGHSAGSTDPIAGVSADGTRLVSVTKEGEALVFDLSPVK